MFFDEVGNHGMTLEFPMTVLKRCCRYVDKYFLIPSLVGHENVLNLAWLAQSAVTISDAEKAGNVVGGVLEADGLWNSDGAVGVDEVDEVTVKFWIYQLQVFFALRSNGFRPVSWTCYVW